MNVRSLILVGLAAPLFLACAQTTQPAASSSGSSSNMCTGRIVLRGVNFATDSSQLTGAAKSTVGVAATLLRQCPNITVQVAGHTDARGSDAYNQGLSERRAEGVRSELVRQGVSSSRLRARGYGESQPIASNDTADGMALNRRVELVPVVGALPSPDMPVTLPPPPRWWERL